MITQKIKQYIADNGIKISYIAKVIGMNENTLSQKLSGKSKISVDEYFAICDALKVSYDTFRINA